MTRTFHLIVRCPFCVLRKWGFTMNFIQYIKQAWKAGTSGGTPLSPDRLNHMEDGIKNNNSMISELNSNNITNNICTNLLNPTLKTSSQNGITCTNNGDGTYTLNGTASARTVFVLGYTADIIKENANKTLRFVSRGDALDTYFVQIYFNNATPAKDSGSGITFKVPTNVSETNVAVAINSGAVLHNIIIKPMLTTNLNATYNDFVSYTGNTGRLNADVALLNNNIGQVELNSPYGLTTAKTLNIDTINNDKGYILRCQINTLQGTLPTSASLIGGNSFLLIGFSNIVNQKPRYGIQIAFGFGSNKIAIRNAPYVEGGGNWTNWRAI